jgi:serine protease Do
MGIISPNAMRNHVIARARTFPGWRVVGILGVGLFLIAFLSVGIADAGEQHKTVTKTYVIDSKDKSDTAYLGVTMQELDSDLRDGLDLKVKNGVLINSVFEDSPAELAGIEDGDVIVEFNGKKVTTPDELRRYVQTEKIGDTVKVKVVRDNETKTIDVTLAERPAQLTQRRVEIFAPEHRMWFDKGKNWFVSAFDSFHRGRLGVRVMDLNDDLGPYFDVEEGEGVLVLEVGDESVADEMGMKSGDVIVEVEDKEIGSVDELLEHMGDLEPGEEFGVTVLRKNKKVTLEGELDEGMREIYIKGHGKHADIRIPHIEKFKFSDDEMDAMRDEVKALQKEMEELKREMKKIKRSS